LPAELIPTEQEIGRLRECPKHDRKDDDGKSEDALDLRRWAVRRARETDDASETAQHEETPWEVDRTEHQHHGEQRHPEKHCKCD